MIEEKKKYEKPEARAVEIQTEAFIATSTGVKVMSDFGEGEGNDGWTTIGD